MGESLFGIAGKDFAIIAADSHSAHSIVRMKDDTDKIKVIENMLFGVVGPNSDTVNFTELIDKNIKLHNLKTGTKLSTRAAANFTRNELATALRKGPYQADLLIAGHDHDGAHLYFMDYLSSMERVNKAAHGYGAYFALSIMDRYYKKDLTFDEACDIIRKCILEMQTRFLMHMEKFIIKVVDKDGVRVITL